MKNQIKKILSLFFLFTALVPVLFTLFILYKQQLIRHEMKEKLEKEMLHTIVVSRAEVHWVKFKKEILVNGKMFDVKSFRVQKGQYIFTGLYDEEETALNSYFEKNTDQNKEGANQLLSSLFKMLQSVYANSSVETMSPVNGSICFRPLIHQHISAPFKDILTPPPQPASLY